MYSVLSLLAVACARRLKLRAVYKSLREMSGANGRRLGQTPSSAVRAKVVRARHRMLRALHAQSTPRVGTCHLCEAAFQIISDGGLCWGDASHDLHGRPMLAVLSSLSIVNSSTKPGQRRRGGLADVLVPTRTFATSNNGSTECLNASTQPEPPSGPPGRLLCLCRRARCYPGQ